MNGNVPAQPFSEEGPNQPGLSTGDPGNEARRRPDIEEIDELDKVEQTIVKFPAKMN